MNRFHCIILFSFIFNLIAQAQELNCALPPAWDDGASYAITLHVSPDGSDEGNGSESSPFRTLERAARDAQPGTRILLKAGAHVTGQHLMNLQGLPDAPIKIVGEGERASVFSAGNTAIQISDPNYLVIENLLIEGASGNGLNIDDGGSFDSPAMHVVIRNVHVRDIGPGGNRDGIKLSGLNNFRVENSLIERAGDGGSGIDMVGCHDGVITGCHFEDMGSNAIQAKGGTARVMIQANRFVNAGLRAVNMGGSTGLAFFRPQDAAFEASNIYVIANLFKGAQTPVAFVGCVNGLFMNNVVDRPGKWVARILQETVGERFEPSSNNVFANNLVLIDSSVSTLVNIGADTAPETFRFVNNAFVDLDDPSFSRLDLPGYTNGNLTLPDPGLLNQEDHGYRLAEDSPLVNAGTALPDAISDMTIPHDMAIGDYEGKCWASPPSIGAFQHVNENSLPLWRTF